jgi:hypothetical protein
MKSKTFGEGCWKGRSETPAPVGFGDAPGGVRRREGGRRREAAFAWLIGRGKVGTMPLFNGYEDGKP